jgi:hypothetical protein
MTALRRHGTAVSGSSAYIQPHIGNFMTKIDALPALSLVAVKPETIQRKVCKRFVTSRHHRDGDPPIDNVEKTGPTDPYNESRTGMFLCCRHGLLMQG